MTSPQPGQGQAPSSLPAAPRTWFVQHGSTIRGAGSRPGSEDLRANVNMTGFFVPAGRPLTPGRYILRVTDSDIVSSLGFGLKVGTRDVNPTVDPGDFDVVVRGSRFEGNHGADITIGATKARVDARGNCWSTPDGRDGPSVVTYRVQRATRVDASDPLPCGR